MADIVTAISQLGSFDHAACDAVLRSRHIDVQGIRPYRGASDYQLIAAAVFVIAFELGVLAAAVAAYAGGPLQAPEQERYRTARRVVLPLLALFGIVLITGTANAIGEYVTTCRALLGVS